MTNKFMVACMSDIKTCLILEKNEKSARTNLNLKAKRKIDLLTTRDGILVTSKSILKNLILYLRVAMT